MMLVGVPGVQGLVGSQESSLGEREGFVWEGDWKFEGKQIRAGETKRRLEGTRRGYVG